MLNDLRKRVGIKTDKELEAKRYEQNLHDRPKASAEEYFELGNMHQRAGDKRAAIAAFLNAATLAVDAEDLTIAMAANRAIIHLEPGHKDALANVAYIRFEYGTELVNKEYDELLQELEERRVRYGLTHDKSEKKVYSKDSQEADQQTPTEGVTEGLEPEEAERRESTGRFKVTDQAESSANKIPTTDREQQREEKSPPLSRPKTGRWKADLQARKEQAYAQRKSPSFEADRKSLIDMIEGTGEAEFSTTFELERRELVDLIKRQDDDDALDESQEDEVGLLSLSAKRGEGIVEEAPEKATQKREEGQLPLEPDEHIDDQKTTSENIPDDLWIESDFTIDLRSGEEKGPEQIRRHLQDCALFSALSVQELQQLVPHVRQHTLSAHTNVIAQDAAQRALWLIFEGEVELSISGDSQQQESSRMNLGEGNFFGEHTFWKQNTMAVSATTHTACTLGEIPVPLFFSYARTHPVMLQLLKKVCKRRYFGAILAKSDVFQECSPRERQQIAECLSPVHVAQGVPILPEGECAEDLFIIQSGQVNVFATLVEEGDHQKIIQDTHEQVSLDKLHEGDVFGEESFFTHSPCFSTFWALTNVLLLKLSGPHLAAFAEQCPQFKHRLQNLHQQRSQATMKAIQAMLS
jgi:CRP-like cAMP-binding protein